MQINTKADLEALRGTPEYADALRLLKGSLTVKMNVAIYPEGYGMPDYQGGPIDPVWEDQECLESIAALGLDKDEFLALCDEAGIET